MRELDKSDGYEVSSIWCLNSDASASDPAQYQLRLCPAEVRNLYVLLVNSAQPVSASELSALEIHVR